MVGAGRLAGKVAVVTGGAGGIGQAIAERYAAEGAVVWIADREGAAVEAVAGAIGRSARAVVLDVTCQASIAAMMDALEADGQGVDVLVNAAGVFGLQSWLEFTEAEYHRIFEVNVKGLAFVTQAVAAHMAARSGGAIVNITSASGRSGNADSVLYSASKMAVISLTQSAAKGLAKRSIRVNAIAPGGVRTPMWETVEGLYGEKAQDITARLELAVPLGRLSTPADQIGAAVFFASDESAYITGQTLNVDGGLNVN